MYGEQEHFLGQRNRISQCICSFATNHTAPACGANRKPSKSNCDLDGNANVAVYIQSGDMRGFLPTASCARTVIGLCARRFFPEHAAWSPRSFRNPSRYHCGQSRHHRRGLHRRYAMPYSSRRLGTGKFFEADFPAHLKARGDSVDTTSCARLSCACGQHGAKLAAPTGV